MFEDKEKLTPGEKSILETIVVESVSNISSCDQKIDSETAGDSIRDVVSSFGNEDFLMELYEKNREITINKVVNQHNEKF